MINYFTISDTHFGHDNVIKYSNRPFKDVEEMNERLVELWNKTVSNDDYVIFLGDFALGQKENIYKYGSRLNGHKIIVLGNHDRRKDFYLEAGFEQVVKRFDMSAEQTGLDYNIIFTHHPYLGIQSNERNIHGHIHDKKLDDSFDTDKYFNASVENINYRPVKIKDIIEIMGW